MRKHLLPETGNFYKANLHTHTTVSDGKLTPEEAKAWFVEHGYSVVAYTDHEVMVPHPELCDENFIAITSYEISVNDSAWNPYTKTYHLNVYSSDINMSAPRTFWRVAASGRESMRSHITPEMIANGVEKREYSKEFIQWVIDTSREEGCIVSYNHPVWSLQDKDDYCGLHGIWGVEWYNNGGNRSGYRENIQPITDLLRQGERKCYPLATDDCHGVLAYGGGWVWIKAPVLEYSEIFKALERGDFYSSTGPEIYELYVEDGMLHAKTSAAATIEVVTDQRMMLASRPAKGEETLCEASFDLTKFRDNSAYTPEGRCAWLRVDVYDNCGKCARTRAYFADEIFDSEA